MVAKARRNGDSLVFLEADVEAYRRCRFEMVVDGESGGTRGEHDVLLPEEEGEEAEGDEESIDEEGGLLGFAGPRIVFGFHDKLCLAK